MELALSLLLAFAAVTRGAHDLWAATVLHVALPFLAAAALVRAWRRGEAVRLPAPMGLALLLGAWIVAAVFAANRADAIFAVKDVVGAALVFFLAANLASDVSAVGRVLRVGVGMLLYQGLLSLYQVFSGGTLSFGTEASGALVNPNILAAFAVLWLPPLVMAWRRDRGTTAAWWWFAGMAGVLASLVAAGSVWAWICLAVAGAIAAIRARGRLPTAIVIGTLGLVVVALGYKYAGGSFDRVDWWRAGLDMLRSNLLTGVGPGGFPSAFPAFKIGDGQSTRFAHSFPVTILAETGLVGALGVAGFIAFWWRGRRADRPSDGAGYGAGVGLFVLFTSVSIGAEYLINLVTVALFLGLASGGRTVRPRLSVALVAVGLAVLAIPFTTSALFASRLTVSGQGEIAAGRTEEAAETFASAIRLDDGAWDAWAGRAAALWAMGLYPDAISAQSAALSLNRYSAPIAARLADMLGESGRPEEAAAMREKARRLNPRLFSDNGPA